VNDHIPDLTKMISDTPRTDAAWKPDGGDGYPTVDVDVARQLERELNAAQKRIKMLEVVERLSTAQMDYIQQLEVENDAMRADLLLWNEKEVK